MSKMIFVNLPVTDLPRSVAFYEAVGATKNTMFSDDTPCRFAPWQEMQLLL